MKSLTSVLCPNASFLLKCLPCRDCAVLHSTPTQKTAGGGSGESDEGRKREREATKRSCKMNMDTLLPKGDLSVLVPSIFSVYIECPRFHREALHFCVSSCLHQKFNGTVLIITAAQHSTTAFYQWIENVMATTSPSSSLPSSVFQSIWLIFGIEPDECPPEIVTDEGLLTHQWSTFFSSKLLFPQSMQCLQRTRLLLFCLFFSFSVKTFHENKIFLLFLRYFWKACSFLSHTKSIIIYHHFFCEFLLTVQWFLAHDYLSKWCIYFPLFMYL